MYMADLKHGNCHSHLPYPESFVISVRVVLLLPLLRVSLLTGLFLGAFRYHALASN